jgi:hypothetical protein
MRGHITLVKNHLTCGQAFCSCSEWLAAIEVAIEPWEVARAELKTDAMPWPEDVTGCP